MHIGRRQKKKRFPPVKEDSQKGDHYVFSKLVEDVYGPYKTKREALREEAASWKDWLEMRTSIGAEDEDLSEVFVVMRVVDVVHMDHKTKSRVKAPKVKNERTTHTIQKNRRR